MKLAVFVITSLVVGGVFWALCGSHLRYDVGSSVNGVYTFGHHEEFSTSGRIIITSLTAILAGFVTTGIWHILQKNLRGRDFSRKTEKYCERTSLANRHPFGTSVMSPADSASRAGVTPEASGDS